MSHPSPRRRIRRRNPRKKKKNKTAHTTVPRQSSHSERALRLGALTDDSERTVARARCVAGAVTFLTVSDRCLRCVFPAAARLPLTPNQRRPPPPPPRKFPPLRYLLPSRTGERAASHPVSLPSGGRANFWCVRWLTHTHTQKGTDATCGAVRAREALFLAARRRVRIKTRKA